MKKTMVIGASENVGRYAYLAANKLIKHGHEIILLGKQKGEIQGNEIHLDHPTIDDIDTVTMYIAPQHQPKMYDYILNEVKPKRIIFNPGTENTEFETFAKEKGIEVEQACTLVMLSIGSY
jgi:predicted CoA-binding protein